MENEISKIVPNCVACSKFCLIKETSKNLCPHCSENLCEEHHKIHLRFCPQKAKICFFCPIEAKLYCPLCQFFYCLDHYKSIEMPKNHELQEIGESLLKSRIRMYATDRVDGVDLRSLLISRRSETCLSLFSKTTSSILMRSSPFSGKTSLAQIYEAYLKEEQEILDVYRIVCIQPGMCKMDDKILDEICSAKYGRSIYDILFKNCQTKPVYFILDEGQTTYGDNCPTFWSAIKKITSENSNFHLLCFSVYGDNAPGKILTTPMIFSEILGFETLKFTKAELNGLVMSYNKFSGCQIDEDTSDFIYHQTNGHVGMISQALISWKTIFLKGQIQQYRTLRNYLLSDIFFNQLCGTRCLLPNLAETVKNNDKMKKLLKDLLIGKPVMVNDEYDFLEKCGLILREKNTYSISCPWMKNLILMKFFKAPHTIMTYFDFTHLGLKNVILETIKRISSCRSKQAYQFKKSGEFGSDELYERHWQMEFYCALTSFMALECSLNCDVYSAQKKDHKKIKEKKNEKKKIKGYLDFLINSFLNWGAELVRNADKLKKHLSRFDVNGKYFSLGLKDYYVIDFRDRTQKIKTDLDMNSHLIIIEYDPEDFNKIDFIHEGNRLTIETKV